MVRKLVFCRFAMHFQNDPSAYIPVNTATLSMSHHLFSDVVLGHDISFPNHFPPGKVLLCVLLFSGISFFL